MDRCSPAVAPLPSSPLGRTLDTPENGNDSAVGGVSGVGSTDEASEDTMEVESDQDDDDDETTMVDQLTDPETSNMNSAHTSTKSLVGSILDYPLENRRRYHSAGPSAYFMPNDELEQTRLNILHQMYLLLFPASSPLTLAPLPATPTHILDLGTGTGEWAIAAAEAYPSCSVTGTDISAIQPSAVPSNVFFEIDDAEVPGDWTFSHAHDLVHMRNLAGAFRSWDNVYREAYRHLKPGGWIEVADADHEATGAFTAPGSASAALLHAVHEAMRLAGRPWGVAHMRHEVLQRAGFVDVHTTTFRLPVGPWREDERGKSLGKMWLIALLEGLEGACLRPLTRDMGWSADGVREACAGVKRAMAGGASGGGAGKGREGWETEYLVVIGRKPLDGEAPGRG